MNKARNLLLVTHLGVALLGGGCSREGSSTLPPPAAPEKPTLTELKPKVDTLLAAHDTVMIRRGIDDVFALVDRLTEAGRGGEAMHYLGIALKHNAWALDYQLRYAEMLRDQAEIEQATQKARLVLEHAEQDALVVRARELAGEEPLPPIPPLGPVSHNEPALVLVAVGPVDRCVLYPLAERIRAELSVAVLVRDAGVPVPGFKRDPVKRFLAGAREKIRAIFRSDLPTALFLRRRGVALSELNQDEVVVKACRLLSFKTGAADGLAEFDRGMRRLEQAPKQWDIQDLFRSLKTAVQAYRKPNVYFMGVANLDAFAGKGNFIFGTAQNRGHHAMIVYRRFTAKFNDETPSRNRLLERTLKQALSSFGFMLGVQRCSTPTCARAYPNSLREHDAKSAELCAECRAGFEQALGARRAAGE